MSTKMQRFFILFQMQAGDHEENFFTQGKKKKIVQHISTWISPHNVFKTEHIKKTHPQYYNK